VTAKLETGPAEDDPPAQQRETSASEDAQEATRIAALLRDRFGIER